MLKLLSKHTLNYNKNFGEQNEDDSDPVAEEAEPEEEQLQEEEGDEEEVDSEGYSEEDIQIIQDVAGGPEAYDNLLQWAAGTLNEQEINMFDHVIGLNDPYAAFFAVNMLKKCI